MLPLQQLIKLYILLGGFRRLLIDIHLSYFRGCLHVEFCALRLTSQSMCLTDESVEDKLQPVISDTC